MLRVYGPEWVIRGLVLEFCFDKLAVESGNVRQRDAFGAFCRACTGVRTVAESEFVHLLHHGAGAAGTLYLTLGKQGKLAYFR